MKPDPQKFDEIPMPPGTPPKAVFHALVECLTEMNTFSAPADRTLSTVFRGMRSLTSRDRAKVADIAYAWLRHLASFREKYPAQSPRRWVIAALVEFGGIGTVAATFHGSGGDNAWLKERLAAPARTLTPAQANECPQWLWQRLVAERGEAASIALMAALNRAAAFDLRVNTLKAKRDEVLAQFQTEGIAAEPMRFAPHGIRMKNPIALTTHPLFTSGAIEVQDEGSQLLGLLVGARRGEMVADFCAGAGGKTLSLGAQMSSTGRLYAMDVDERRMKQLAPRMNRAGLTNVTPLLLDSENDARLKKLAHKFDRVLVDAPCSGLGTLRRNPDLKWRQSEQSVDELVVKQLSILIAAARLVKPGGRLVYATCSLLNAENQAIVDAFMKRGGFKVVSAEGVLNIEGIRGEVLTLDPVSHGCDGFYACVMERIA